jgi:hypothetical protein
MATYVSFQPLSTFAILIYPLSSGDIGLIGLAVMVLLSTFLLLFSYTLLGPKPHS